MCKQQRKRYDKYGRGETAPESSSSSFLIALYILLLLIDDLAETAAELLKVLPPVTYTEGIPEWMKLRIHSVYVQGVKHPVDRSAITSAAAMPSHVCVLLHVYVFFGLDWPSLFSFYGDEKINTRILYMHTYTRREKKRNTSSKKVSSVRIEKWFIVSHQNGFLCDDRDAATRNWISLA